MLLSIFEKHIICLNQQKQRGFCDGTAPCYLTSPFFLQCYKPQ